MRILPYALMYGGHRDLHARLAGSLETNVLPHPDISPVRVWCNQVCGETKRLLGASTSGKLLAEYSDDNVPKYLAMRELFRLRPPPDDSGTFVMWFDDDSWVTQPGWSARLIAYLGQKRRENVCYVGKPYFVDYLAGQWDYVSKMPWFRGVPPEKKGGRAVVTFATGGFWLLRADLLNRLDWPPTGFGLRHNGGDTLLGEAVRQQGLRLHGFDWGVKINDAPRRGLSEAPAGCLNKNARR